MNKMMRRLCVVVLTCLLSVMLTGCAGSGAGVDWPGAVLGYDREGIKLIELSNGCVTIVIPQSANCWLTIPVYAQKTNKLYCYEWNDRAIMVYDIITKQLAKVYKINANYTELDWMQIDDSCQNIFFSLKDHLAIDNINAELVRYNLKTGELVTLYKSNITAQCPQWISETKMLVQERLRTEQGWAVQVIILDVTNSSIIQSPLKLTHFFSVSPTRDKVITIGKKDSFYLFDLAKAELIQIINTESSPGCTDVGGGRICAVSNDGVWFHRYRDDTCPYGNFVANGIGNPKKVTRGAIGHVSFIDEPATRKLLQALRLNN